MVQAQSRLKPIKLSGIVFEKKKPSTGGSIFRLARDSKNLRLILGDASISIAHATHTNRVSFGADRLSALSAQQINC